MYFPPLLVVGVQFLLVPSVASTLAIFVPMLSFPRVRPIWQYYVIVEQTITYYWEVLIQTFVFWFSALLQKSGSRVGTWSISAITGDVGVQPHGTSCRLQHPVRPRLRGCLGCARRLDRLDLANVFDWLPLFDLILLISPLFLFKKC